MVFLTQKRRILFMYNGSLRLKFYDPSPVVELYIRTQYGRNIFYGLSVENFVKKCNNLRNILHTCGYKSFSIFE